MHRFGRARRGARGAAGARADRGRDRRGAAGVDTPTGNMVVDIGGGTTEIAVIALNGIVTKTSIRVGGDEMDEAIVQLREEGLQHADRRADRRAHQDRDRLGVPAARRDGAWRSRAATWCAAFRARCGSPPSRSARRCRSRSAASSNALRESLERTPPELAADIVDRGIFMTGGGALLRGLDLLLREVTNLHPRGRGSAHLRRARRGQDPREPRPSTKRW